MTRIFISYRRIDTSGYTGRLFDRLEQYFGRDTVFMDVTGIEPGLDFYEVIEEQVASCDVLIAMIGPRWLTAKDAQGRRRLDNPNDFVRLEIGAALKRNIRVIPALVGGASMPYATDLPDDLRLLTRRNALTIDDQFHSDVDRLIKVLEKVLKEAIPPPVVQPPSPPKPKITPKQTSKPKPTQKPEVRDSKPKTLTPKPETQDSKPETLTITKPFEMGFVRIPTGEFLMGSDPTRDKYAKEYEQPQHKVILPDYYIGKYPVTNSQFATFVEATGHQRRYKGGDEDHPAIYVSWLDAVVFCRWLTRRSGNTIRLPTEAEWEKAVRGTDGRIYPWGDSFDKTKLNSGEGGPGSTTPVDHYLPDGDSPYGVADMAGNVWEWCSTIWDEIAYPFQVQDEWYAAYINRTADQRAVRGGAFLISKHFARCAIRHSFSPLGSGKVCGFRIVFFPI